MPNFHPARPLPLAPAAAGRGALWVRISCCLTLWLAISVSSAVGQDAADSQATAPPASAAGQSQAAPAEAGQSTAAEENGAAERAGEEAEKRAAPALKISDAVRQAVAPMVRRIAAAESLRVTTKMSVASAVGDEVLGTTEGLFQIASEVPNRLALSAKFQDEAVRFVSDGENLYIQIAPEAYIVSDAPQSFAALASAMPVQLGPQPEPMLWLSLAGVDPSMSLLDGLISVEVVGQEPVGDVQAVQVRGVRQEGVVWTLSISADEQPRPLRLHIDMTEMITRSNNLEVPEDYSFSIRYDFERWEIDAALDEGLFKFDPPADAERFDSIADYLLQASEAGPHPLLGQPAPELEAKTLSGESVTVGGASEDVVVLEFWASWCAPCVEAMPKMAELAKKFEGKNIKFYAVNVSEEQEVVEKFLKELEEELGMPVLLDPEGEIATAYAATAIPQTVLIGKGGRVEAVHVGFDFDKSPELLQQELETLLAGRRIYEAEEIVEPAEGQATGRDAAEGKQGGREAAAEGTDEPSPAQKPGA